MLHPPPFKFASGAPAGVLAPVCCPAPQAEAMPCDAPRNGRIKLAELDTHFQCSVIGTCFSTAALRKLMARFIDVVGSSDLDIHHDAVSMASEPGAASKALHKALDHQHDAVLQRFARASEPQALAALWDEALASGDIPGAYWAVLTHRRATDALRKRVFGDVHMLSHLVGAANRADIRRLVALEQANADLRDRVERQQAQSVVQDESLRQLRCALDEVRAEARQARAEVAPRSDLREQLERARLATELVAVQTQRREAAEQQLQSATDSVSLMRDEVAFLRREAGILAAELQAAESQLRQLAEPAHMSGVPALLGRRILYVGGRPSSTGTIRDLVLRHGGEFRHHDGGLEDRKGLLAAGVSWAEVVVFPVDCVDHDSVGMLKRVCARQGIRFMPLRSAGVGCFASALSAF